MPPKNKITVGFLKAVNRVIEKPESLETMGDGLTQFATGALKIKGCSLFVLNPETQELEILSSFGLSTDYLNKGPVIFKKSIRNADKDIPVVIKDVRTSSQLQYPEAAKKEGIGAIVHLPITFSGKIIGALRLYHSRSWSVSSHDLEALGLLADTLALALMYTRLLNAFLAIRDTVTDVHTVWLSPQNG